jgi:hypothetical protein
MNARLRTVIGAAIVAAVLGFTATANAHDHFDGYNGGYGGYNGSYGGYGAGYGGYGYGPQYSAPRWHDTSHFDYHPGTFYQHGNHFHYQPGHYDFHRTGHWHH